MSYLSISASMASSVLICDTVQRKDLQTHVGAIQKTHLRDLMTDADRCKAMTAEFEGIFLDYSRQHWTKVTMEKLLKLAEAAKLKEKIQKMFQGERASIMLCGSCSVIPSHVLVQYPIVIVLPKLIQLMLHEASKIWTLKPLLLVKEFGIDPNNAFAFWDWVGGRYSVCSAVGVLPLSLQYGFAIVQKFLEGASSIDNHFQSSSFEKNIPVLLGLLSVWNVSFLGYPARAILPYSQALEKFAPHIQQVCMESNGKGVSINGVRLPFEAGEIDFGEPGTNGQHSFYQLIHQGRVIPCDFIGVIKSQQPVYLKGETVSNHDELMSNFFAQPDALAYGKTPEQLHSEKVPENLIPHKTFQGNRPSLSLLLSSLSAYEIGQLLSIYEHRVAVQGFIWGINSFDQWGVELGKSLASQVRKQLHASRMEGKPVEGFNPSSASLLARFLAVEPSTPYDTTVMPKV